MFFFFFFFKVYNCCTILHLVCLLMGFLKLASYMYGMQSVHCFGDLSMICPLISSSSIWN